MIRIRLRLTKGDWRLDYLALADLDREVTPIRLDPFEVLRGDAPDTVARGRREELFDRLGEPVGAPGEPAAWQRSVRRALFILAILMGCGPPGPRSGSRRGPFSDNLRPSPGFSRGSGLFGARLTLS
ncbi:MAG: hypothetical protein ABI836_10630 [Gemmatimonadota bacterium]